MQCLTVIAGVEPSAATLFGRALEDARLHRPALARMRDDGARWRKARNEYKWT